MLIVLCPPLIDACSSLILCHHYPSCQFSIDGDDDDDDDDDDVDDGDDECSDDDDSDSTL